MSFQEHTGSLLSMPCTAPALDMDSQALNTAKVDVREALSIGDMRDVAEESHQKKASSSTVNRRTKVNKGASRKSKSSQSKKGQASFPKSAGERSSAISDVYVDPESENIEYSVFYKLEDVDNYILEQEITQTTKFILNRICKGFGTPDPDLTSQKKQRVKWIASGVKFIGKPFVLIGDKRFDCRHGKDKNVAKKVRYNEKRRCLVDSGEQQRINNVRKSDQLKMNCPAKIQIRDILVYTEFGVEGAVEGEHDLPSLKDPTRADGYVKHNAQRRLRDRTSARLRALLEEGKPLKTERQFHVSFPKLEAHSGHEVGQAAGTNQPVDRRLILHMHKLVGEGVIHIDHMKSRLNDYVVELFAGKALPNKENRRYYPLTKDLSNHIQKAMASLMNSKRGTENLELLYENLRKENPTDNVYFTPSVPGESRLIYVHQTADQKWLLKLNATRSCLLLIKYREKKSSLPMFFISVQTSSGYQTVGTFILEDESDLQVAIHKLQEYNPTWFPAELVVEHCPTRISTLQAAFPKSLIRIKESQSQTGKRTRKRGHRKAALTPPPPKELGETLRDILREFSRLSYLLPCNSHSWNLVNSLNAVLTEAKVVASGSTVTTSQLAVSDITTASTKPKNKPVKRAQLYQQDEQQTQIPINHQSMLSLTVSPTKIQCPGDHTTSALRPTVPGLTLDTTSHTHHNLFSDQQNMSSHSYTNSNHNLISHELASQQQHHQQQTIPQHIIQNSSQQALVAAAAASSATHHGLFTMSHGSSLPLQVTGMLTDGYQIHCTSAPSITSMYGGGQLTHNPQQTHRTYLDLQIQQQQQVQHQHADSQSFIQRIAKITSE